MRSDQAVPSRHGVHWPQLSCAKNWQLLCRKSTIDTVSSITTTAAVPSPRQPNLSGSAKSNRQWNSSLRSSPMLMPPGNGRLGPPALPHAAAVLLDQLVDRQAQRRFVAAGAFDMPAEAIQLGTEAARIARIGRIGRNPQRTEPIRPAVANVFDARHRLDVVDDGRLPEGTLHGRERRLDARPGPFAFQALDQAGLFPADIRAGPPVQEDVQRSSRNRECADRGSRPHSTRPPPPARADRPSGYSYRR